MEKTCMSQIFVNRCKKHLSNHVFRCPWFCKSYPFFLGVERTSSLMFCLRPTNFHTLLMAASYDSASTHLFQCWRSQPMKPGTQQQQKSDPKPIKKWGELFFFQAVKSSQTTRPLQMYLENIFWISGLTMEEHATSVQSTQTSFSNLNFTGKVQLVLKVMFSVWSEIWVGRKTYWFNFMSLLFKKGSLYRNKKGS